MAQRNGQAARDRSPIDQQWMQHYVDELLKVAHSLPEDGAMRAAILRRAECCMDLLEAWQRRNEPRPERS